MAKKKRETQDETQEGKELLGSKEAAELLGISQAQFNVRVRKGLIKPDPSVASVRRKFTPEAIEDHRSWWQKKFGVGEPKPETRNE